MEWTTKKICKINEHLALELDVAKNNIKIDNFTNAITIRASTIKDLIAGLNESLTYFVNSKPIAKPKTSDKISTSHNVDGRLVTGVSWDKNKIQLDNSDWISVDNARQYHKGDTYHG